MRNRFKIQQRKRPIDRFILFRFQYIRFNFWKQPFESQYGKIMGKYDEETNFYHDDYCENGMKYTLKGIIREFNSIYIQIRSDIN